MSANMRLIHGNAPDVLRELPAGSVQTCVTSPPYFGLRNYGIEGQIGLEETPEQYVAALVGVFAQVRRVLRADGTLWLNLGDSYVGALSQHREGGSQGVNSVISKKTMGGVPSAGRIERGVALRAGGLKPKDLIGIPWLVAFALRADGWWLRSEITWCKRAPMPESVRDRPTSATEKIFLFAKADRYYYDQDAVRVGLATGIDNAEDYQKRIGNKPNRLNGIAGQDGRRTLGLTEATFNPAGRNLWNYWLLGSSPFPEAHFATFPPEIPRRCILAGTSERGGCAECGAPWERVIERTGHQNKREAAHAPRSCPTKQDSTGWAPLTRATDQWQPTCKCNAGDPVPQTVLDPFSGAGTTGLGALQLGRRYVGIDLNQEYVEMSRRRIECDERAMCMRLPLLEALP